MSHEAAAAAVLRPRAGAARACRAGRGAVRAGPGVGPGTPLQNDLGELQSLLSFLLPDVFGADGQLMGGLAEVPADPPQILTPYTRANHTTNTVGWQRVCMCLHSANANLSWTHSLVGFQLRLCSGGRRPSRVANCRRFIPELAGFHAKQMLRWHHIGHRLRGSLGL